MLVLHWITSKDNASTLSASRNAGGYNSSRERGSPLTPRSQRMTSGITNTGDIGLSEYYKRGGVTTLVTASKDPDGDELVRAQSKMPPNVITVESEHVVEIEPERSIETDGDHHKLGRMESTEDLFRKV